MLPARAKEKLARLLGPRGYLDRPEDLTSLRVRRQRGQGASGHRRVSALDRRRGRDHRDQPRIRRADRGPRRGHRIERRCNRARGRHHDRLRAHEPRPRNRFGKRARGGAAGRGQSGHHAGRRAARVFLCARPLEPTRLHHRRQCGRKCRRAAHAGVWRDHESRAGARSGAAGRRGILDRRQSIRIFRATI